MTVLTVLLAVLLMILKIIGIALLAILVLFFLICFIRIGVMAEYSADGLLLMALAGPVKLQLLPRKEKKKGDGKQKKPKTDKKEKQKKGKKEKGHKVEQEEPEQPKEKKNIGGMIPMFKELLGLLVEMQITLRSRLRFKEFYLRLTVGAAGADPASGAILYGRAWAAIGNLMPQLMKIFRIEKRDVGADVDFLAEKNTVYAKITAVISIGGLVRMAVYYGVRALRIYLKHTKEQRKAKKQAKKAAKKAQKLREKEDKKLQKQSLKGGLDYGTSSE